MKRAFDIFFAVVMLLLTWPILLFSAATIKLTSKGPVFYCARRVGKGDRVFTMYKLRTMHINQAKVADVTAIHDARIYPFGKFLRKTKIDELPQLFNILLGDMSVVGPRPEDPEVAKEWYVGKYENITLVRPGLTSPASLFDYTHGEKIEDLAEYRAQFMPVKLEMELYYIRKASMGYDLALIMRTASCILQTLFGKKAFKYPKEYQYIKAQKGV